MFSHTAVCNNLVMNLYYGQTKYSSASLQVQAEDSQRISFKAVSNVYFF